MAAGQLGVLLHHIHRLAGDGRPGQPTDRQLLEAFAAGRDEAAFAELVARHGPLVLGVCRRVLRQEQDAEDAFQATFLVLARNVGSIRKREAVAGWLYGVAYRTAMKARRSAARRREHEGRAGASARRAAAEPTWNDVQAALDEEVERLPGPFRAAFALCVLEGTSVHEAAAALGCKSGTVSSRVTRARRLLRERLARRGIALSAVLAALAIAGDGRSAVPAAVAKCAVRYGLLVAAGEPAAGVIPAHVADLAAGVTGAMFLTKSKIAAAVLLVLGCVIAGASVLTHPALATPREQPKPEADGQRPTTEQPSTPEERAGSIELRGRVLDPDGQPVTGARLWFVYATVDKAPERGWATSSPDGRFHFTVARNYHDAPLVRNPWDHTFVIAAAEGYGFAWAPVRSEKPGELTLRLVKDDLPIQGRVIDLQGKPVAGATVRIDQGVFVPTKGDLAAWLKALEANKRDPGDTDTADLTCLNSVAFVTLFPPVQTGADGRFEIKGIGRERVVGLRVEGPTIAPQQIKAMTRPAATIRSAPHGAPFDLPAVPTRPVVGVVRDKDTGKPLAGVTVRSHQIAGDLDLNGLVRTTTDRDGHYRLVGLPKGPGNAIIAEAYGRLPRPADLPYLPAIREVGDAPGLEPVTVDVNLRRGVWLKGRVIDKTTGQAVPAGFDYFCFGDNPLAAELPLMGGSPAGWTQDDGSFRTVVLPGRGLVAVRADRDDYRMGVGADRIKGPRVGEGDVLLATYPYQLYPGNFHTIIEVSPRPGQEAITCDVVLDPGRSLKGTVLGPDGKPLAGARIAGLRPLGYWEAQPLGDAEFTLHGLASDELRLVQVIHEGKKLAGWLEVGGGEKGPVRVRLQPWGSAVGRLVTPGGAPVTGVSVGLGSLPRVPAAKDGTFRIDGLAPGRKYGLSVLREPGYDALETAGKAVKDLTVEPGETRDLGEIKVKSSPD